MNLFLFDDEYIVTFNLPSKKIGNFWLTDNNDQNVVNISGVKGDWIITGSEKTKIFTANGEDSITLKTKSYYSVEKNEKNYVLFCDNSIDNSFESYKPIAEIKVGKAQTNNISIGLDLLN